MNRSFLLAMGLAAVVPAAFAQTAAQLDPGSAEQVARSQELSARQAQNVAHNLEQGERQSWLNAMANLAKLRLKLAEAWQGMGVSPEGAKVIADAYDPNVAAGMHHASLRGKSDQEVAQMLQSSVKEKKFMIADQLLIDYQRQKLRMGTSQIADVN